MNDGLTNAQVAAKVAGKIIAANPRLTPTHYQDWYRVILKEMGDAK